jgi:hypothetical protein
VLTEPRRFALITVALAMFVFSGFFVPDNKGNGDLWLAALDGARPFVGRVLIEEKANGGDVLARITRENPRFLDGFSRVSEGGRSRALQSVRT